MDGWLGPQDEGYETLRSRSCNEGVVLAERLNEATGHLEIREMGDAESAPYLATVADDLVASRA